MSQLLAHGVGWRGVFFFAAAAVSPSCSHQSLLLRETPAGARSYRAGSESAQRVCPIATGVPELRERAEIGGNFAAAFHQLRFLAGLPAGFRYHTLLRETFNLWTPTYFVQFVGLSPSVAASRSALFPLCGGVSVLARRIPERQAWRQTAAT